MEEASAGEKLSHGVDELSWPKRFGEERAGTLSEV